MISWLYGVCFCTFLYLKSLGDRSEIIIVLPLLLITFIAMLDIGIRLRKKKDVAYRIALATPLLTVLLIETTFETFNYAVFITVLTLDTVVIIVYSYNLLFVGPPRWLIICNMLSFVSYCATYMLLYAVLESGVKDVYALIPFGIMVLVECYVIYILSSKGMDTVTKERSSEMSRDRLIHSVAIVILFIVSIVHCFDLISDTLNFALSALLYFFGLVGYYVTRLDCKRGVRFESVDTINEFGIDSDDEWG
jgi:hypothetical protein